MTYFRFNGCKNKIKIVPDKIKQFIRFVTNFAQKYVGLKKPMQGLAQVTLPSMVFFNQSYFCVIPVTEPNDYN